MESQELAQHAAQFALAKKAKDIVILDLNGLSDVTNYFVVCTGESDTQVKAIADAIDDGTREMKAKVWRKEGFDNLQWVLLDFVDVVVHVFQPKIREYYDIERLWGDAPLERVED
ncbi:MAG: ribosome silencing factor [Ignavibacteria bacterium]|nr:MAG: ribosome silencing factor [Ignavibacteria bacterium]